MGLTGHAAERVEERLTQAGWTVTERAELAKLLQAYAAKTTQDTAVRFAIIGHQVNAKYGNESNGDTAWAVIRGGRVITMMLRRIDQPDTNLRVAKVARLERQFDKLIGRRAA